MPIETRTLGGGSPGNVMARSHEWWLEDDPGPAMVRVAQMIEADQADRYDNHLRYAKLYANQDLSSLYAQGRYHFRRDSPGLAWNLVRAVVDTIEARIGKQRPRAMFLTTGGNWGQQRRAQLLSKFVDGVFDASKTYTHTRRALIDSMIFDGGVVRTDLVGSQIKTQRVLPYELLVDETDGIYEEPQSLYQRRFIHRSTLLKRFKDDAEAVSAIETAHTARPEGHEHDVVSTEMIPVYEGWHLGDEDGEPGRHVVAIREATLSSEKWVHPWHPFSIMLWSRRSAGYWGQGLVEQLVAIQLEINSLLRSLQKAAKNMGEPTVLRPTGSKIVAEHIGNGVKVLDYAGDRPPTFASPAPFHPSIVQLLELHWERGFQVARVSQLSATAQKPPGLDAAVALQTFHDIENEGFVTIGQAFEEFHLDIAHKATALAREAYAGNKEVRVKAPGTKELNEISWKDVDLREDQYVMRQFPTSSLPQNPALKQQRLIELFKAGWIDKETALRTLDYPDIEDTMNLRLASLEDTRRVLDQIVTEGKYEAPEPFMPLEDAVRMATSMLFRARAGGADDARIKLLHQWIDEAVAVQAEIKPPPPPPPVGQPLQPDAAQAAIPQASVTRAGQAPPPVPAQATPAPDALAQVAGLPQTP